MRPIAIYLPLISFTPLLAEAAILPRAISDTVSHIPFHAWRRKKQDASLPREYPKYFHEPDGSDALHHYDSRYHHRVLGIAEKQDTQTHLIRSYLEFFQKNGMETWLAHGTLLGWWWNAQLLPWDWDIDTQVSIATLEYLAENHNNTIYTYTSDKDIEINPVTQKKGPLSRQYHLDINPAIHIRHRNKGDNIIDARWIDKQNGLYIDITGLAETDPKEAPGIWSCKNYHRYKTRDLWPMRRSIYEGFVAKVPYAYERILGEEYGEKALVIDEYQGHRWSKVDHVWVKKTPREMKQRKLGRQAIRLKKLEEKATKWKLLQNKEKDIQIAKDAERKEQEEKETEQRAKEHEREEFEMEPTKERALERRMLRKDSP